MTEDTALPVQDQQLPPPRDYRIATPEGWERIVLNPEAWDASIARIVDKQFKGVDNAPHLNAQMRESLAAQARQALAAGGLELYLSLMQAASVPLPGSLLVTLIPPRPGRTPPPLDDLATAFAADGDDVRMVDFPAGPALRRRWSEAADAQQQLGNTRPVEHLDFHLAVPYSEAFLVLSFSTPMVELAEALDGLFESIASTLRWLR
ncbi:hypothetical protein KGQ20_12300 [Catenulispora sp. NF23]|uniref:hypothetical protein n=1 Tax=Catenulispora pinistramenti TaxID=2705254 RepID=UPI001BAD53A6|nr:hypothetical protein [Catenulispora pinistramenti]MBS2533552.1 hypothetical protein [Catenulispora pinistramenti]